MKRNACHIQDKNGFFFLLEKNKINTMAVCIFDVNVVIYTCGDIAYCFCLTPLKPEEL